MGLFGPSDDELKQTIEEFPETFKKVQADWAKFKLGLEHGLFSADEIDDLTQWFADFVKVWDIIRPNWEWSETGVVSPHRLEFANKVSAWVEKLAGQPVVKPQLGAVVTIVLIGAGLVVAAMYGKSFMDWAASRLKDQENKSKIIDAGIAGKLSKETVDKAVAQEQNGGGLFGDLESLVKTLGTGIAVTAGLLLFWPQLKPAMEDMFKK